MNREGQVIYENKSIVKMHRFNLHMVPVSAIFFDSVPQCRYHQDFVHIDRGYSGFLHEQKESLYLFCARGKPRMQIILLALLSGFGLSFFNMISALQFMLSGAMEEMVQVQTDDVSISLLYIVLSVAGAVVEELFFRGILLNLCRPYDRAASAIIISAVLLR